MDKLTKQQQDAVKRTSTDRLRLNLLRLGYDEDEVCALDREALLAAWAEVVAAGKDKPRTGAAAEGGVSAGYDVQFERERLAFERQKFASRRPKVGRRSCRCRPHRPN